MITNKTIMKFLKRLEGKQGCNFRNEMINGKMQPTWNCDGKTHTKARAILEKLKVPCHEIDEIIEVCELNGGYCDCEILFNAEGALLDKYNK